MIQKNEKLPLSERWTGNLGLILGYAFPGFSAGKEEVLRKYERLRLEERDCWGAVASSAIIPVIILLFAFATSLWFEWIKLPFDVDVKNREDVPLALLLPMVLFLLLWGFFIPILWYLVYRSRMIEIRARLRSLDTADLSAAADELDKREQAVEFIRVWLAEAERSMRTYKAGSAGFPSYFSVSQFLVKRRRGMV